MVQGDFAVAEPYLNEAASLFEQEQDLFGMTVTTFGRSYIPRLERRYADAAVGFEIALQGFEQLGKTSWMVLTLSILGSNEFLHLREFDKAERTLKKALRLGLSIGYEAGCAPVLENLGHLALRQGKFDEALARYHQALPIWKRLRERHGTADTLGGVAQVDAASGSNESASRMLGAAAGIYERLGFPETRYGPSFDSDLVQKLRELFGADRFEVLWREGQQWSLDEAIDAALNVRCRPLTATTVRPITAPTTPGGSPSDFGLTARELEVARLLVGGRSTSEIAGELEISPRTVGTHVRNILAKLDVNSRAAAVAVILRNGLI
jgi:DNA-binding CsgD family transcriptional regulator/tetratricopeptide (TPR) repeat protein